MVTLLAGCTSPTETSNGEREEVNVQPNEQTEDGTEEEEVNESGETEQIESGGIPSEKTLNYTIESHFYEEKAYLHESTNQHFSMYLFSGLKLEAEEPGKDMVLSKEDKDVFMRIELLPADTATDKLEQQVTAIAEAISPEFFHNDSFLTTPFLEDSVWYKAYTEEVAVSIILIKSTETPMLLTIHTPREKEVIQPFLAMAETIQ